MLISRACHRLVAEESSSDLKLERTREPILLKSGVLGRVEVNDGSTLFFSMMFVNRRSVSDRFFLSRNTTRRLRLSLKYTSRLNGYSSWHWPNKPGGLTYATSQKRNFLSLQEEI